MINTHKYAIYTAISVLAFSAILLLLYFQYEDYSNNVSNLGPSSTSTPLLSGEGGIDGFILEDIPTDGAESIPVPELRRAIPESSVDAETMKTLTSLLEETIKRIEADPYSFEDWVDLGVLRMRLRDYEGAKEAWEYHSKIYPENALSFNNLGNLYHYYLKDYGASERNYLMAIQNDPASPTQYRSLHDLYRLSFETNTSKAEDILKKGLSVNPEAMDLNIALASYYKDKKDTVNSLVYYQRAIEQARLMQNEDLAKQLQIEIDKLQ